MSSEEHPLRILTKPRAILAVLVLLVACFCSATIRTLTFGWIVFLFRSLANVRPRWDFLLIGLLAFGGLTLSIHLLSRKPRFRQKLGWRFSLMLSMGVMLLFASGTAIIGVLHHTVWILTDRTVRTSEAIDQEPINIPVISNAREAARRSQWRNQIRSVGFDTLNHITNQKGRFAAGGAFDENGNGVHSWSMMMLPGIVYADWNEAEDWKHPDNAYQCKCLLPEYVRPSTNPAQLFDEEGYGLSELAGNVHVLGINKSFSLQEITDGASNTILIGEVRERLRPWCDPANVRDPSLGINQVPWGFGAKTTQQGAFFILCDGSVKFLSKSTDQAVLQALSTPTGGEVVDF